MDWKIEFAAEDAQCDVGMGRKPWFPLLIDGEPPRYEEESAYWSEIALLLGAVESADLQ